MEKVGFKTKKSIPEKVPVHSLYLNSIFDLPSFIEGIENASKTLRKRKFDAFAVCGNSGTLFGGALSLVMKKRLFLVRKINDGSHAFNYYPDGEYLVEGSSGSVKNFIFLDDQVVSGKTKKHVLKQMEKSFPDVLYIGDYLYLNEQSSTTA